MGLDILTFYLFKYTLNVYCPLKIQIIISSLAILGGTINIRWDLQTGILGDSFQGGGTQFFKDSSAHYGPMRNISSTE